MTRIWEFLLFSLLYDYCCASICISSKLFKCFTKSSLILYKPFCEAKHINILVLKQALEYGAASSWIIFSSTWQLRLCVSKCLVWPIPARTIQGYTWPFFGPEKQTVNISFWTKQKKKLFEIHFRSRVNALLQQNNRQKWRQYKHHHYFYMISPQITHGKFIHVWNLCSHTGVSLLRI